MKRKNFTARNNFEERNAEAGMDYGTIEGLPYWEETVGYEFTQQEVSLIERATEELVEMSFQVVDNVVSKNRYSELKIPGQFHKIIANSWKREDWSFYGRFDFCLKGNDLKLFEYNADTPTSLLESSITQFNWMKDRNLYDQFNSLHEKMIDFWKAYKEQYNPNRIYFSCIKGHHEDFRNSEYILDTCAQAGIDAQIIFVEDIGSDGNSFYDLENNKIKHLFKLYPWEWLINEEFGKVLLSENCQMIEPAWKMILSNKGFLALLFELFPTSPWLLPTYFSPEKLGKEYVKKPFLSREGQNIEIISPNSKIQLIQDGVYASENNIYQKLMPLPEFDGFHPVIGSWVIGELSAGMGIREDQGLVTGNLSRFVPHYIKK